jgi:FtsX-like permease family protein
MRALLTKTFADVRHRKVQAAVVMATVMLVTATSALALTMPQPFGVLTLAASAAIVANLVSGIAAHEEAGVMQAIGYTPGQVVAVSVLQLLAPAAVGCVAGGVAGEVLSRSAPDSAAAAVAILAVVAIAAALPARLEPGAAPGGAAVARLLSRKGPIGTGDAFARPLRAALATLGVLVAVATAISSATVALAVLLALTALAGASGTALLNVRNVATLRAIGMTPAQTLAMVVASAGAIALAGALPGVPLGLALHHLLTVR